MGLTACGATHFPHPVISRPATLRMYMGPMSQCNPITAHTTTQWASCSLIYDTLTTVSPNGVAEPQLASHWKVLNPTHVTIYLNPYAKWWNGRPISAHDVAWSLRLEKTLHPHQLSDIRTVSTLTDTSLSLTLFHADPGVMANTLSPVGHTWVLPAFLLRRLPTHSLAHSRYLTNIHDIVGSGPYRPVSVTAQRIRWIANPRYWLGAPQIRTISWWAKTPPESSNAILSMVTPAVSSHWPAHWPRKQSVIPQLIAAEVYGTYGPDEVSRLAAALSRRRLVTQVFGHRAEPASGPFVPSTVKNIGTSSRPSSIVRLNGLNVTVIMPTNPTLKAIAEHAAGQWSQAGAKVLTTTRQSRGAHGLTVRFVSTTMPPYPPQAAFAKARIYLAWPLRTFVSSPNLSGVAPNPFILLYHPERWRVTTNHNRARHLLSF